MVLPPWSSEPSRKTGNFATDYSGKDAVRTRHWFGNLNQTKRVKEGDFKKNKGLGGSIPGLGISSEGGHGNPLQDSCLENPHGQKFGRLQSMWSQKTGHD